MRGLHVPLNYPYTNVKKRVYLNEALFRDWKNNIGKRRIKVFEREIKKGAWIF